MRWITLLLVIAGCGSDISGSGGAGGSGGSGGSGGGSGGAGGSEKLIF